MRIDWKKKGAQGVKVYGRKQGEPAWTQLGLDYFPPYFDTRPLTQPNVPEVREYKARGMMNDEDIGQDSDIVSVTFAG